MKSHFKYLGILLFVLFSQIGKAQNSSYVKITSEVKGDSLYKLKEYSKALIRYNEALPEYLEQNNKYGLAEIYHDLYITNYRIKEFDKTLIYLEKELEMRKEVGTKEDIGRIYRTFALTYKHLIDYKSAITYFDNSISIRVTNQLYENIAVDLFNLAGLYMTSHDFTMSISKGNESIKYAHDEGNVYLEALNHHNIGMSYSFISDFNNAILHYQLAIKKNKSVENIGQKANSLNSLALIYKGLNDNNKSMSLLKKALQISEDHSDRGLKPMISINMAIILIDEKEYTQAIIYLNEALKISQEIGRKDLEANCYSGLGEYFSSLKDYDNAIIQIEKSLSLKAGHFADDQETQLQLSELYLKIGERQKALNIAKECFRFFNNNGFIEKASVSLSLIGDIYSSQGNDSLAIDYYKRAVDKIENIQFKIGIESQAQNYMKDKNDVYRSLINSLIKINSTDEIFTYLEKLKARLLLDILDRNQINIFGFMTDEEIKNEKILTIELEYINTILRDQENGNQLDSLISVQNTMRNELTEFRDKTYLKYPDLIEYRATSEIVPLRSAKKFLNRREAVIYFMQLEDKLITFVLTRELFEIFNQEVSQDSMNLLISQFNFDIKTIEGEQELDSDASNTLYEILISPIKKALLNKKRICFIPDKILNQLPFQALQNQNTQKYLIEEYAIYSNTSMSTLKWLRNKGTYGSSDLCGFANPYFGESISNQSSHLSELLTPLPATEKEVYSIQDIYDKTNTKIFIGKNATETNFRLWGPNYGVLHLATHAIQNDASPLYSSIVFSPDKDNDGFLEAHEIIKLELNADIVILSACKTAFGEEIKGDGRMGLSRAFFAAEVPTVIGSLWSVNDESTQELMVKFHKKLKQNNTPAVAMQKAQLHLLKSQKYSHPFYWAPFIVMGDSD